MGISSTSCFQLLKERFGDLFDDSEIELAVRSVQQLRDSWIQAGGAKSLKSQEEEFIERMVTSILIDKVKRATNLRTLRNNREFLAQFGDTKRQKRDGLLALIAGREPTLKKGASIGADQMFVRRKNKWLQMVMTDLDKQQAGLAQAFRDGLYEKEIMTYAYELGRGGELPVVTKEAELIAKAIHRMNTDVHQTFRRLGVPLGFQPGYIFRQTHDPGRLAEFGVEEWAGFLFNRLDQQRTFGKRFGSPEEMAKMLFDDFNKITKGVHEMAEGTQISDEFVTIFGKKRSLTQLKTASRTYHFKNGQAFFEYNEKFGRSNLFDSIFWGVESNARATAMIEKFGTDPRARIHRLAKDLDILDNKGELDNIIGGAMNDVMGYPSSAGRGQVAKWNIAVRALNSFSKLALAGISSMTDLATAVATIKSSTGDSFLKSVSEFSFRWMETLSTEQRVKAATRLDIMTTDVMGEIYSRFNPESGSLEPGRLSKLMHTFFKYTGLNWVTDSMKVATAKQISFRLGDFSGTKLGDLDDVVRGGLSRYGIEDVHWDVARSAAREFSPDQKVTSILPENIEALDDAAVKKIMDKFDFKGRPEQFKVDVADKIAVLLQDHAEHGSPTPGARQRAFMFLNQDPDSVEGQVLRHVMQFKSFPVTMMNVIRRLALSDPKNIEGSLSEALKSPTAWANLSSLFLFGTVMGYFSISMKDFVKGKTPPDPTDTDVVLDAFIRGGTGGIFADVLLEGLRQHQSSKIASLAGPTASVIDDTFRLAQTAFAEDNPNARTTKAEKLAAKSLKFAQRHVPGLNFPLIGPTFKYMIIDNLMEIQNPGYMQRQRNKMEKKGQRYWLDDTIGD